MATAIHTRKPLTLSPVVSPHRVRRFTLAEYHILIDTGVLKPGDPYELLNGVLKYKMPQNTPHASTAGKIELRSESLAQKWGAAAVLPTFRPRDASHPLALISPASDRRSRFHPPCSSRASRPIGRSRAPSAVPSAPS